MTTKRILIAGALLILGPSFQALGQNKPDELKQRILTQAQNATADDYAFTRTSKNDTTSSGKTEQRVTVEKFDPTKAADDRWTLVSINGAAPSADDTKRYRGESAKRRVPGYYRLANYFGSPSTASTDARGRTVFRFTSLPKNTLLVMDSDVSQNATADASVTEANGTAFVEQLHVSIKPTRIKLIAKIERYESTIRYKMGPEGKPLLMESTADVSGSGMGQSGQVHTATTYSDYRAVKK